MASAIDSGGREFRLGEVFGRAFAAVRHAPFTVLGLSFLFGSIPQIGWNYFEARVRPAFEAQGAATVLDVGAMVFGGLTMTLVQGLLTPIAVAHEGKRARFAPRNIVASLSMVLPLLGLAIVNLVAVAAAALLLVVPGFMVLMAWSASAAVLTAERTGITASLRRSAYLTKGVRWRIFGLFVLLYTVAIILIVMLGLLGMATGFATLTDISQPDSTFFTLVTLAPGTVINALWGMVAASLYIELRYWKDGFEADDLAEIFS